MVFGKEEQVGVDAGVCLTRVDSSGGALGIGMGREGPRGWCQGEVGKGLNDVHG